VCLTGGCDAEAGHAQRRADEARAAELCRIESACAAFAVLTGLPQLGKLRPPPLVQCGFLPSVWQTKPAVAGRDLTLGQVSPQVHSDKSHESRAMNARPSRARAAARPSLGSEASATFQCCLGDRREHRRRFSPGAAAGAQAAALATPDTILTYSTQAALHLPPAYRDIRFSVARSGENPPGMTLWFSSGPSE
jgi:hypothetical protein